MAPPYLESLHPLFMGHGVIVAMTISGCFFVVGSLVTQKTEITRLSPFFPDKADVLVSSMEKDTYPVFPAGYGNIDTIDIRYFGQNVRLHLSVDLLVGVSWKQLLEGLVAHSENWHGMTGLEAVQRFAWGGEEGGLSIVTITRGENPVTLWLEIEGSCLFEEQLKRGLSRAYIDVVTVLELCREQQSSLVEEVGVFEAAEITS